MDVLIDIESIIDIFNNDLIDIDIFKKCRYIDNQYGLSIYRTPLPDGKAELNLTFQLPSASELIPPPFHMSPVPIPQRPILPLFPKGYSLRAFGAHSKTKHASQKKPSSKQRKNY